MNLSEASFENAQPLAPAIGIRGLYHYRTSLNQFELNQFEPVWTNLNQFELIWTKMNQFANLNQFESIWTILTQFDPIWTNLNQFEPIWTGLIKLFRTNLNQSNPII